jgi:hypothetical protein
MKNLGVAERRLVPRVHGCNWQAQGKLFVTLRDKLLSYPEAP